VVTRPRAPNKFKAAALIRRERTCRADVDADDDDDDDAPPSRSPDTGKQVISGLGGRFFFNTFAGFVTRKRETTVPEVGEQVGRGASPRFRTDVPRYLS